MAARFLKWDSRPNFHDYKKSYPDRYPNNLTFLVFVVQIRQHCASFREGMADVIKLDWLQMFSSQELQVLISGASVPIDIGDLKRHTNYSGGFCLCVGVLCVCVCVCKRARLGMCVYMCVCLHGCVCMQACMPRCVCVLLCASVCVCVRVKEGDRERMQSTSSRPTLLTRLSACLPTKLFDWHQGFFQTDKIDLQKCSLWLKKWTGNVLIFLRTVNT